MMKIKLNQQKPHIFKLNIINKFNKITIKREDINENQGKVDSE